VAQGGKKAKAAATSGTGASQSAPQGPQVSGGAAKRLHVPILMYHSISIPPAGASLPELFVPTGDFTDQMRALQRDGYHAVTLDQLWGAWHGQGSLPEKPIVLSFDDGYQTQYTHAAPVLKQLGWPGVLNLKLLSLEQGEMTPKMIKSMISDGWEIDSHTINHLDVSQLSGASLHHEIADSRKMLQKQFGVPSNFFCYPAGRYDDQAIAALKAAGYTGATTELPGEATIGGDPFTLPRIRISGSDGVAGMEAKLASPSKS
jgi:peptidoglycan/xylan/chitin deacetylase (PgdA/CDA1 family)